MASETSISCFGAAHWDYLGQSHPGHAGPDRPGTVRVRPGGVAANVSIELAACGLIPDLFTVVGRDRDGESLLAALRAAGVGTEQALFSDTLPTGRYVAVEDEAGELISAVADCRAIEALTAGAFHIKSSRPARFWFVEANLPPAVIEDLAAAEARPPLAANPVSPARANRLKTVLPLLDILYCNRAEAEALCDRRFRTPADAVQAVLDMGARRAVVTDGPRSVYDASSFGIFSADPDPAGFASATGAGDAFLARHLAAVIAEAPPSDALHAALRRPHGKEQA